MTWELTDKCPHCGHRAAIHSGPGAQCDPGTCWEKDEAGVDWCECPGWHPMLEAQAAA